MSRSGPDFPLVEWQTDVTSLTSEYRDAADALHALTSSQAALDSASYVNSLAAANATKYLKAEQLAVKLRAYVPEPDWSLCPMVTNVYPPNSDVSSRVYVNPVTGYVQFDKALYSTVVNSATISVISSAGSVYFASVIQSFYTGINYTFIGMQYNSLAAGSYSVVVESDDIVDLYGNSMAVDYVQVGSWLVSG